MSHRDRVRVRVPIERGHGTQSLTSQSTVSGTQWDTVGTQSTDRPTPRLVAEALARRAQRDAARRELNERRTHGLKRRHAAKLAHLERAKDDGCAA